MKFGKEFMSQMVPEWQEAYMNYNFLKGLLKDLLKFRQQNMSAAVATPRAALKRRLSLYRAFSGLTGRYRGSPRKRNEDEAILVSAVEGESSEGCYQTMFLMSSDEGGEYEVVYFRRLDEEFNKVVKFYREKVEELMKEAEELNKQMDALIALRIKVDNPLKAFGGGLARASNHQQGRVPMDVIKEVEMSEESQPDEENRRRNVEKANNINKTGESKSGIEAFRPASLRILNHVKINVEPETPISTLKRMLACASSDLSFTKEELRRAEELMTRAFVEFYQKLRILKSYSFLNQLAFAKIMKKYDKITSRNASKAYLQMVDNSPLGSSEEVTKLVERVEATFIKHFANGNHSKGMDILRPKAKKERHRVTYLLGFLSGCSIALVVAIVITIQAKDIMNRAKIQARSQYMDNIFPLYSLFGFIVLHMLMYAANIYFWRRYRVNYTFIFGFKPGTVLGYREVLLLSSVLSVMALAGVLSNLDIEMDPRTKSFTALAELVPLGLVIVVLLIIFCPFNIIYRSSRFFFIQCAFHCMCAPLFKVTLPDFFLADQLTSQVQAFRSLEFYVCYYGWGNFRTRSHKCLESDVYKAFYVAVAVLPFCSRFLQCCRRWSDEKNPRHALNALKYFSTIAAVVMRTGDELFRGGIWKIMAATSSGIATIANTYWDIVVDWGLLRWDSKNPWLRDKLLIPSKSVYFVAIVLNIILRLAWMQTVLGVQDFPFLHRTALVAVVACLEIIRRGIWNFFRLENEHLNNVGKYRAFKSVPLPFNYDEEDKHA